MNADARIAGLLTRCAVLQSSLGTAWLQLTQAAGERFSARAAQGTANGSPPDPRQLYDAWIDCAEKAYSEVAHTEAYCQLQAELINVCAALVVEQRRLSDPIAGGWRPAMGLPLQLSWQPVMGTQGGVSLRQAVWQQGRTVLYRYRPFPFTRRARAAPVLICYSLVNRPHVLDLQADRSLIRGLLAAGLEVYLVDWGYPGSSDAGVSLHDYINVHLHGCIQHMRAADDVAAVNLLGVCQGGTFALCYSALHPQNVANLTLLGTPVDFHTADDLLSKWARPLDVDLLAQAGNLSGQLLTGLFLALSPFRLIQQKYVSAMERMRDPAARDFFLRMEAWIFDCPDIAATAATQYLRWFYQENRLLRGGLALDAHSVIDLQRVRQPVLNVYATRDHIVPPASSAALRNVVASRDYTDQPFDTGHIGLYVSDRARTQLPGMIGSWLAARS
jgi:polyhydroxyalkanoate synthase subunit PhaC